MVGQIYALEIKPALVKSLKLDSGSHEFVSDPFDRLDKVIADFGPQTTDMYVDGAVHHNHVSAPNCLKNPIPGHNLIGV